MDRIQRKRIKGFKLPPNTLVINRPSKWGNPFKMRSEADRDRVIIEFSEWVNQNSELIDEFISYVTKNNIEHLACFCSESNICHGDVWLDVWNEYKSGQSAESELK